MSEGPLYFLLGGKMKMVDLIRQERLNPLTFHYLMHLDHELK